MFRYIGILLLVIAVIAFLWPTLVDGARLARDKFRKMHAEPPSYDKPPDGKRDDPVDRGDRP